jgi:hypothetical protein
MERFTVFKNDHVRTFRKVNEFQTFKEAEYFVHHALAVPQNALSLYTIEFGLEVISAYKLIDGQIVCHSFSSNLAA